MYGVLVIGWWTRPDAVFFYIFSMLDKYQSMLAHLYTTVISCVTIIVLCSCSGDQPAVNSDPDLILPPPPMDSSVLGMHADLRLADSLLNHSRERDARDIYQRLYDSMPDLDRVGQRRLYLRLALTSVGHVDQVGDSVYDVVADLIRSYLQLAGQSEFVSRCEDVELAVIRGRLAMCASNEEAHHYYQEALEILRSEDAVDPVNAQRLLSRIGREYLFRLEWNAEAREVFQRERQLLDKHAYPVLEELQYFYRISIVHRRLGQFELAEAAALNGIQLHRHSDVDAPELLFGYMNNMAYIGMAEGDTAQAGTYIDSLLPLVQTVYARDTLDQIYTLMNYISTLHHDAGRATRLAETALRLSEGRYPFTYADILRARAYVLNADDRVDEARADFGEAIKRMRETEFTSHLDEISYCDALFGLAFVLIEKFRVTDGVQEMLDEAVELYFDKDLRALLWQTEIPAIVQYEKWDIYLGTYARYLLRSFENEGDTVSLLRAVAINKRIDSLMAYDRRKAIQTDVLTRVSRQHELYTLMVDIARMAFHVTGDAEMLSDAHRFMERSRAYLIESEISFAEAARRLGVADSLIRLESDLLKSENVILSDASRYGSDEWKDLIRRKEIYYQRIRSDYPELYDAYIDTEAVSLDSLRSVLDEGVCVIEYQTLDTNLFALAFTRDTVVLIHTAFDVEMVRSLVDTLSRRPSGLHNVSDLPFLRSHLYAAYQSLIAPFQGILVGNKTLYIMPDGILQYLPFEALVTFGSQVNSFEELPYLFLSQHIGYAISSGTLYRSLSSGIDLDDISAFAYYSNRSFIGRLLSGDDRKSSEFADLPGAMREVKSIAEIFSDRKVAVHYKKHCTTARFFEEARQADVLHLGIHAFADRDSRFGNGMVFVDTILHPTDLIALDLAADLVVLSGCETGLGKQVQGEGMFNFARPFITAGANQVVMSRWLLHDQTASVIMHYFYENVKAGMPAHEALSEARRTFFSKDVRPKTAHPYYWSLMSTR